MKNQPNSNVTLAVVEGFFFYFLAGVFTTRKGGNSLRGLWAGFWAGIFSTIVFWAAFFVGLLIQVVQYYRQDAGLPGQSDLATYIGQQFHSIVDGLANSQQNGARGVITYLVAGLIIAMVLGLCGGLLGRLWARRRGFA